MKRKRTIPGTNDWSYRLYFEPRDIWIGVYHTPSPVFDEHEFYICFVPMFPLLITKPGGLSRW